MRASVYKEHGVLVIDFTDVSKRSPCVDVAIHTVGSVLTVEGFRQEWAYQNKPDVCEWTREDVPVEKVRSEYTEIISKWVTCSFWERVKEFFNLTRGYGIYKELKNELKVKPGWVRLKQEYEEGPFRIETTLWRVKYKD